MIFTRYEEVNALFKVESGAPERFVDSIQWPFAVDLDVMTDKLFQTVKTDSEGGYRTLSPVGVLCAGRKYIEEDALRRLMATHIDYALKNSGLDSMQNLVMYVGPSLLSLNPRDEMMMLSEAHIIALEHLHATGDVWEWLCGAIGGTTEYEGVRGNDCVKRQEVDDAVLDLYERLTS
jgi:hypothetical protein